MVSNTASVRTLWWLLVKMTWQFWKNRYISYMVYRNIYPKHVFWVSVVTESSLKNNKISDKKKSYADNSLYSNNLSWMSPSLIPESTTYVFDKRRCMYFFNKGVSLNSSSSFFRALYWLLNHCTPYAISYTNERKHEGMRINNRNIA